MLPVKVEITTRLAAPPIEVWAGISNLGGVNREMGPWLRMTAPEGKDLADAAGGEVLPLRLHGPLGVPLGTYPLRLVRIEEGTGFLEQTWMLPFLLWQHERTIAPDAGGTAITDRLGWRWRAPRLDRVVGIAVGRFFRHRHRELVRRFGRR